MTPIHAAAINDDTEICKLLQSYGYKVDNVNNEGNLYIVK